MVGLAADDVWTEVCPWNHVFRVEHAEFETTEERAAQVLVKGGFLDESFVECLGEHHEDLSAFEVCAVEHSVNRCRKRVGVCLVLSFVVEVVDGVAVCHDDAVEVPLAAQDVNEQAVAGTAWHALVAVVGAHDFAHVAFLDECLEGWEVGFPQVAHRD